MHNRGMLTKKQINLSLNPPAVERLDHNASAAGLSRSAYVESLLAYAPVAPAGAQTGGRLGGTTLPLSTRILQRLERLGGRASITVLMAPWRGKVTADDFRREVDAMVANDLVASTVVRGPRGRPSTVIHETFLPAVPPWAAPPRR